MPTGINRDEVQQLVREEGAQLVEVMGWHWRGDPDYQLRDVAPV